MLAVRWVNSTFGGSQSAFHPKEDETTPQMQDITNFS
jgi:hypothetical protein